MPSLLSAFRAEINLRLLKRAALILAPLLMLTLLTGDANWLKASVVTMSLFIVYERVELASLGVALHALALLLTFMVLFFSMSMPVIFVLACVLTAAAAVGLSTYGRKLRSLGNFTFIPALYLACETADGCPPMQFPHCALPLLPYLGAATLPVLIISLVDHLQSDHALTGSRMHHFLKLRRNNDLGARVSCGEALIAVSFAVALAAAIVEWQQLDYGQWVIWSAVSVITGDMTTARKKLYQRGTGALVGAPIGALLGYLMPHNTFTYELLIVAAMLTLVSFQRYILGFGARCGCIACALVVIGHTPEIAAERAFNVLLGSSIGLLFVFLLHCAVSARSSAPR